MKMKNLLAGALTVACAGAFAAGTAAVDVRADDVKPLDYVRITEERFPDPVFRAYVKANIDTTPDDILEESELDAAVAVSISDPACTSLQGVEFLYNLQSLDCSGCSIESLALSANEKLSTLIANGNKLTSLMLAYNSELVAKIYQSTTKKDDLGDYYAFLDKDDVIFLSYDKNVSVDMVVDVDIELPVEVAINEVNFPDEIVRKAVKVFDYTDDDMLSISEIIAAKALQVDGASSLKGVEYLVALENLVSYGGELTSVDVSHNLALENLELANNKLTALDVSKNVLLNNLNCHNNEIAVLDVNNNTLLESLNCSVNKISDLNIDYNTLLRECFCSQNDLTILSTINNPALERLDVGGNGIATLELSHNTELVQLTAHDTELSELDLSHCPLLKSLYVSDTEISELDISCCPLLEEISLTGNKLKVLDLSQNADLRILDIRENELETLDVSKCTKLINLRCDNNKLETLELGEISSLEYMECNSNLLTKLDVSHLKNAIRLMTHDNKLTDLDISGCTELLPLVTSEDVVIDIEDGAVFFRHSSENTISGVVNHLSIDEDVKLVPEGIWPQPTPTPTPTPETDPEPTISPTPLPPETMPNVIGKNYEEAQESIKNVLMHIFDEVNFEITWVENEDPTKDETVIETDPAPDSSVYGNHGSFTVNMKVYKKAPAPEPTKKPEIADFVKRLYTVALNRDAEEKGLKFWVEEITKGRRTGGDCARDFLFTEEFENRKLSIEDFVETLYKTFFDRESEPAGKKFWVDELKSGRRTRIDVINGFIDSTEWCNLCATYCVRSGAITAKAEYASQKAIDFATRLYSCCLGREPEEGGLKYWSMALTNLEETGAGAARFFFESPEFVNLKTTDEEYITRLYKTFMDREPEKGGFEYWVDQLKSGSATRHDVLVFFGASPEFTAICAYYGIERGTV